MVVVDGAIKNFGAWSQMKQPWEVEMTLSLFVHRLTQQACEVALD